MADNVHKTLWDLDKQDPEKKILIENENQNITGNEKFSPQNSHEVEENCYVIH